MPTQSNLLGSGCPPLQCQASLGIVSNNLTAVGTTQGTALVLPSDFNIITTAAASTGAILPIAGNVTNVVQVPDSIIVVNHGANPVLIYPPVGGKVANGTTNAGLSLGSLKTGTYNCVGPNLYSAQISS